MSALHFQLICGTKKHNKHKKCFRKILSTNLFRMSMVVIIMSTWAGKTLFSTSHKIMISLPQKKEWQTEYKTGRIILQHKFTQKNSGLINFLPRWPNLPDLPIRWRYVSEFFGKSKFITTFTAWMSIPRVNKSENRNWDKELILAH